jgi:adenylate cyclase
VAVLYFENSSRDSNDAYLADGLTEEITTKLGQVSRLAVTSRTTMRRYRSTGDVETAELSRTLRVAHLVNGSVRRAGHQVRVNVELVRGRDGVTLWTESYDRRDADLLAIEEEIARAVATAIAGRLLPEERTVLAARTTRNPEAYDRFLRGNFYLAQRTPLGVRRAIDEYGAAARLDPSLAQAEARVALGYALYLDWGWQGFGITPDTMLERGFRAANRAIAIDSACADGWMSLGYLRTFRDPLTYAGVMPAMERAVALEPRNAEAWHQYGSLLGNVGRFEEGVVAEQRALALEPQKTIALYSLGGILEALHRGDEAGRLYDSTLSVDPAFYAAYFSRAWFRLRHGDVALARSDAEAALRTAPAGDQHWGLVPLAAVAAREGDSATARSLAQRAAAQFPGNDPVDVFPGGNIAAGLMASGDIPHALDWLERVRPRGSLLWFNMMWPGFDPIRSEPRFQRLQEAIRPPGAPR